MSEKGKDQLISDLDGSIVRSQAAFVNKLYKMLEDSSIQYLISWSDKGDLFSVSNPTAFSKSVLPQYFKHNNWQSFVRQLNMYGFHKVNDMIHSNLTTDNQTWEFKHPHFRKGAIEDLQNIKRKNTKQFSPIPSRMPPTARPPTDNDDDIYGPMYKHILHIEDRLHHVSRSHEILKCETNSLRNLLVQQQKVIGDLASLFSDSLKDNDVLLSKLYDIQSMYPESMTGGKKASYDSEMRSYGLVSSDRSASESSSSPFIISSGDNRYNMNYNARLSVSTSSQSSNHEISYTQPIQYGVNRTPRTQKMGFGKESYLLNPEPPQSSNDYSDDDSQKAKKLRSE